MAKDRKAPMNRRGFLKATGTVGSAAALANLSAADEVPGVDLEGTACGCNDGRSNELLVGVSNAGSFEAVEQYLPDAVEVKRRNEGLDYILVDLPDVGTYGQLRIQSEISGHESVRFLEPNERYYPMSVLEGSSSERISASDPLFEQQYAPQMVRADVAWEKTMGNEDVTISVIDQGAMYDHPDLKDRFGQVKGKDFVDDDDDPYPKDKQNEYHGTHVAGIAAGTTGNGQGMAGISNCTLLSCRALGTRGGRTSDIADAVDWSAEMGADVINMSLGGGGHSSVMQNALSNAVFDGVLPVAAAGNDCAEEVSYPAKYDECVAVSAIDSEGQPAGFTNKGPNVDVAAPGVNIVSCWPTRPEEDPFNGKYNAISGTSMACPVVAGVAGLARSVDPSLTPEELRARMKDTAVDLGLPENTQGAGRVDAVAMVDGVETDTGGSFPDVSIDAFPQDPHLAENTVFRANIDSESAYAERWEWSLGDGTRAEGEQAIHSYEMTGSKTVSLTVTMDDGSVESATRTIEVQPGTCGGSAETTEFSGSVGFGDERSTHMYDFKTDNPCKLDINYEGQEKLILYIYQESTDALETECQGQILLRPRDLRGFDPGKQLVVGMYSGSGFSSPTGDYDITIEETGYSGADGEAPSADFLPEDPSGKPREMIEFDASPSESPNGSIQTYEWEFGDGTTDSGLLTTHSYAETGNYEATLTITDDAGHSDSTTKTVSISENGGGGGVCGGAEKTATEEGTLRDSADKATMTYGLQTTDPCEVTLDLSGPAPEEADYDMYVTYDGREPTRNDWDDRVWEYGTDLELVVGSENLEADGELGVMIDCYSGSGDYTLDITELGVAPDDGDDGDDGGDDGEEPDELTAVASAESTEVSAGEKVLFDARDSAAPNSTIESYSWEFGDGESKDGEQVAHTYKEPGDYEATLTVTDDQAKTDSDTLALSVSEDMPPIASFTMSDAAVLVGQEVTFDGSLSTAPDGEIESYQWNLGDSTEKEGEMVSHEFGAAGEFEVELTVTDSNDLEGTSSQILTVSEGDGGGGNQCGPERATESMDGRIDSGYDDQSFTYTAQLNDPCQLTVKLQGPKDADFDLYMNGDGSIPGPYTYDWRSMTPGTNEEIIVDDVSSGQEFGILVDAWEGDGEFTVTVDEFGKQ